MSGPAPVMPAVMPEFATAAVKGALARGMTTAGGSATAADARLVRAQLERMPMGALQIMSQNQTKVVTCRGTVTDYRPDLKGKQPRGWEAGKTWDQVPGAYVSEDNMVVVATVGHGTAAGAHVAARGEGHGSRNLAIHESFHAVDLGHGGAARSDHPAFVAARNSDLGTLRRYELQPGAAGRQETYAESAARYYGGDPRDAAAHPRLHEYWDKYPPKP